jgi:serine/threonine-protein kinase
MQEVADWTAQSAQDEEERTVFQPRGPAATGRALAPIAPRPVTALATPRAEPVKAAGGKSVALIGGAFGVAAIAAGLYFAWPAAPDKPRPPAPAEKPESKPAPSPAESIPAPKPTTAARMRDYVEHADIGGCALLVPTVLTETSAKFDGIGLNSTPFEKFDHAFHTALGVEPDIDVRQIAPSQCPALDFVARIGGGGQLKLNLRASEIRSGDVLSGTLSSEGANLDLLIVDDQGKVHSASSFIKQDNSFAIKLREAGGGAHPMLLIGIVSPAPVDALRSVRGQAGEVFFTSLAQEVAGLSGLGASARYFTID